MMPSRSRKKSLRGYEEKLGLAKRFLSREEEEIRRARAAVDRLIGGHKEDAEADIGALRGQKLFLTVSETDVRQDNEEVSHGI